MRDKDKRLVGLCLEIVKKVIDTLRQLEHGFAATETVDESFFHLMELFAVCSSCQVIYINTDDMKEVRAFAELFLPVLQKAVSENAVEEIGIRARDTLVAYTQRLKSYLGSEEKSDDVLRGKGMSLILASDSRLELSPMMCNVLIKPLPKEKITEALFDARYYLQTAGVICPKEEREELISIFVKCGLTRITRGADMSSFFPGESHDGEYALDRYMKTVNIEVT